MSRLNDWLDANSAVRLLALICGLGAGILVLALAFGFALSLATIAPMVAGIVVFSLCFLAVMAWARIRSDTSDSKTEASLEGNSLAVLKERYARGEISEEEFEHRVTMLLDVDELFGEKQEAELVAERN